MKINVKNMVCQRCITTIEKQLNDINLSPKSIELGEIDFGEYKLTPAQYSDMKSCLEIFGFEVLDSKTGKLIDKSKRLILSYSQLSPKKQTEVKLSDYLKRELSTDYYYVSKIFSTIVGKTMRSYLISVKIEKVKELIIYDELTLDEIAYQLGYSSVAHLSNQFKKVTGFTPTYFKEVKSVKGRISLDKL